MRHRVFGALLSVVVCLLWVTPLAAQEETPNEPMETAPATRVVTIKPNYLPPAEVLKFLGVRIKGGRGIMEWQTLRKTHTIDIWHNDAANLLILSGPGPDVDFVETLIQQADIPPRQIEIEVKIVEVSTSEAQDLGIDWEGVLKRSRPRASWSYNGENDYRNHEDINATESDYFRQTQEDKIKNIDRQINLSANLYLSEVLHLLDESGTGTVRSAPRILTLNNRRATILDGQRVTYITKYSSYTNLFETDSMDAGLTLSVLPSLGESGFITLQINSELTSLAGTIADSPVKDGQMLESTVVVRDGEAVLLGGFTRTVERTGRKRFPILGHVLPFLFSRETKIEQETESFIILTPRVVDFATAIDEQTRHIIEGN